MSSRYFDIVLLLGAGASADAGILTSNQMVEMIEHDLVDDRNWRQFASLYNHIKSGIFYAFGIRGTFGQEVPYNIENLVSTLYELERNEQHPLYPFIASMNSRLLALAGPNFENVRAFREKILDRLKKWMSPEDSNAGSYYAGLRRLQGALNFPLHVFSLNYDLCVERLDREGFHVETGFEGYGRQSPWDWVRLSDSGSGPEPPQVYLYKLHGSINWTRDQSTKQLYRVEQTASVDAPNMELIFGKEFKVEVGDPYLFYLYQFRVACLSSRLVVVIGYSFGDSHINSIIAQALRGDSDRRVLLVTLARDETEETRRVSELLGSERDRVTCEGGGAKQFLERSDLATHLLSLLPKTSDAPF